MENHSGPCPGRLKSNLAVSIGILSILIFFLDFLLPPHSLSFVRHCCQRHTGVKQRNCSNLKKRRVSQFLGEAGDTHRIKRSSLLPYFDANIEAGYSFSGPPRRGLLVILRKSIRSLYVPFVSSAAAAAFISRSTSAGGRARKQSVHHIDFHCRTIIFIAIVSRRNTRRVSNLSAASAKRKTARIP